MSEVLVLVENTPQGIRKSSLELLTAARRLGSPSAVLCGAADDAAVATLGEYGAATVYVVPGTDGYLSVPAAEAIVDIAGRTNPVAVLVTSGPVGKDVAARVAVRLGAGIVTDATDVRSEGGVVTTSQTVVSGQWVATAQVTSATAVVTVRPNAIAPEAAPATPVVQTVDVAFSAAATLSLIHI